MAELDAPLKTLLADSSLSIDQVLADKGITTLDALIQLEDFAALSLKPIQERKLKAAVEASKVAAEEAKVAAETKKKEQFPEHSDLGTSQYNRNYVCTVNKARLLKDEDFDTSNQLIIELDIHVECNGSLGPLQDPKLSKIMLWHPDEHKDIITIQEFKVEEQNSNLAIGTCCYSVSLEQLADDRDMIFQFGSSGYSHCRIPRFADADVFRRMME
eukprot:CAMPEP_0181300216 /NCGR_PEP_ID=MMETSP1101-20121128/6770_1 /TAXON_ID=46948 /ORGANISM="Rhodomonas abbreviata, Strain Caron Lab Isolate" /LENGTH=214 /DNA_ID=CAMNT_0023405435 /DNA_START=3 /DNA_END=647 /DNA_ORIENTATION=-